MTDDDQTLLSSLPLLSNIARDAMRELASAATWSTWESGAVLFEQGDIGDVLYFVVTGRVEVTARSSDGADRPLATAGPGEAIGELALLDGQPRSARATATEQTTTLVLERVHFLSWLGRHPSAAGTLLRTLATRLRETDAALLQ